MPNIVTIHQPDFMPWIGLFHKINNADCFVLLNHVEVDVKNSGWIKRVKHNLSGNSDWISIPLKKPTAGYMQSINEIIIDLQNPLFVKTYRRLSTLYAKHPFYDNFKYLIDEYFSHPSVFIWERNFHFIQQILTLTNIHTEIIFSSQLPITLHKNEMNAEIIDLVGGKTYLSGSGATEYQNEEDFNKRGIFLRVNNFNSNDFSYNQKNTHSFLPGLSVLDVLMNEGKDKLIQILNS